MSEGCAMHKAEGEGENYRIDLGIKAGGIFRYVVRTVQFGMEIERRNDMRTCGHKFQLGRPVKKSILDMAEGNPGAIRVLCELVVQEGEDGTATGIACLASLDELGIYGSSVWVGYKDFAGQNIRKFMDAIQKKDPAMLTVIDGKAEGYR